MNLRCGSLAEVSFYHVARDGLNGKCTGKVFMKLRYAFELWPTWEKNINSRIIVSARSAPEKEIKDQGLKLRQLHKLHWTALGHFNVQSEKDDSPAIANKREALTFGKKKTTSTRFWNLGANLIWLRHNQSTQILKSEKKMMMMIAINALMNSDFNLFYELIPTWSFLIFRAFFPNLFFTVQMRLELTWSSL